MKKPMLLSNDDYDLDNLDYTEMYISEKRDGVRAEVSNKGILGRSLKRLPNVKMQEWFKEVYENLPTGTIVEAEIHSDSLPCRIIAGICNSDDKDVPEDLKLYIFGIYSPKDNFSTRMIILNDTQEFMKGNKYKIIKQVRVHSAKEATKFYEKCLENGYEGAVLMDGRKFYKENRVTINEHIGFKMKPQREDDLEIIGITERMENLNESETNELGRSFKHHNVDMLEPTGIAAAFVCKLPNGEECKVTLTGDEKFRRDVWKHQKKYVGKHAVVLSMDYGVKDKLRHPRLIRVKEAIEK